MENKLKKEKSGISIYVMHLIIESIAFADSIPLFFLFEDLYRFVQYAMDTIKGLLNPTSKKITRPGRRGFIRKTGLLVASIPFVSMLYGITKGKYDFKVILTIFLLQKKWVILF